MSKTTTLIPATRLTASDAEIFYRLGDTVANQGWLLRSHMIFVSNGRLGAVFVANRTDPNADSRCYVFRAYSEIARGGIEMCGRYDDFAAAAESRLDAASEVADLIYDNRR